MHALQLLCLTPQAFGEPDEPELEDPELALARAEEALAQLEEAAARGPEGASEAQERLEVRSC